MNWKFTYLFVLFSFFTAGVFAQDFSEVEFVEKIKRAVYKKKYKRLKKYLVLNGEKELPMNQYRKLETLINIEAWLDTINYPEIKEEDERIYICAFIPSYFEEYKLEDGTKKRRLVKKDGVTRWRENMHTGLYFHNLNEESVSQIQKILKNEKWFAGKVNGKWSKQLFKAIKFYEAFELKLQYDSFSNPPNRIEQHTLYQMKLIDKNQLRGYRAKIEIIEAVQKTLLERGYDVEVNNVFGKKTKTALLKFQKENNLPVGQLDFETLKALDIEY